MLTREEQLDYCKQCKNKKNSFEKGIICSLTGERATFQVSCDDFVEDEKAKTEYENSKAIRREIELEHSTGGLSKYGVTDSALAGTTLIFLFFAINFITIMFFDRVILYSLFLLILGLVVFYRRWKSSRK